MNAFLFELLKILLVIIGWIIVHYLSEKRDIEKSKREMIAKTTDSLREALTKTRKVARNYHLSESRDESVEDELIAEIKDVINQLMSLKVLCQNKETLKKCLVDLKLIRQAITKQHFADAHNGKLSINAQQLHYIDLCITNGKNNLLLLKNEEFAKSK